ncbi:hypothetical protein V1478_004015 [Vespula squamosa]|uniref:Uncharacterized protein n=1 Tax=Vespula squamosa TaxID=30214 RepID=A0ABD2BNH5_VESSQ
MACIGNCIAKPHLEKDNPVVNTDKLNFEECAYGKQRELSRLEQATGSGIVSSSDREKCDRLLHITSRDQEEGRAEEGKLEFRDASYTSLWQRGGCGRLGNRWSTVGREKVKLRGYGIVPVFLAET